MEKSAIECIENLDASESFDYWHCHIDWMGKGDKHEENRVSELHLAYEILKKAETYCAKHSAPIQSWLYVHESAYEDALYLHSENDNGTDFPYKFEGVEWEVKDNVLLNQIVDTSVHKVGVINNEYGITYVVTANA